MNTNVLGKVMEIRRFPVKSILGESLTKVTVDERGFSGDRLWAIRNGQGKFGSGKTTRRFQRMNGLFRYQAAYDETIPVITMPDGSVYRADDDSIHEALSAQLGFPVTLAKEESISHYDEGPISILTTSSLRQLSELLGEPVDPRRFRANLLIDTESLGYVEDDWIDKSIKVGQSVVLKIVTPLNRCVMVNNSQEELLQDNRVLRTLAKNHHATFAVWANVIAQGEVSLGDSLTFV